MPPIDLELLAKYFDRLPETERKVLALVVGLDGPEHTINQAAKALGIKQNEAARRMDRGINLLLMALDVEDHENIEQDIGEALVVANMRGLIGTPKAEAV